MLSTKRAMMIAAVSLIFLFTAFGAQYIPPAVSTESIEKTEREGQSRSAAESGNFFFGQDCDAISMYGDPKGWDDEKNMSLDTNGDGQNDINFAISASKNEGVNLEGSVKQKDGSWKSMNFWSSDLYRLFRNSLKDKAQTRTIKAKDFLTLDVSGLISLLREGRYIVKGSCLIEDDYVQITVCDIDQDGSDEVLASVGNRLDENVTAIYELSDTGNVPFIYSGCIISE